MANSAANPLTLANGFYAPPNVTTNTFAVDPNFRVGYAQIWQLSVQRDLPGSLVMVATYTGPKGRAGCRSLCRIPIPRARRIRARVVRGIHVLYFERQFDAEAGIAAIAAEAAQRLHGSAACTLIRNRSTMPRRWAAEAAGQRSRRTG